MMFTSTPADCHWEFYTRMKCENNTVHGLNCSVFTTKI